MRDTINSPSELALLASNLKIRLQELQLKVSGTTTGGEVATVVTKPSIVSDVVLRALTPAPGVTTPAEISLVKVARGSATEFVLGTVSKGEQTTPDYLPASSGISSSTSVAQLVCEPGDVVKLRYTNAGSASTDTVLVAVAELTLNLDA